MGCALFRLACLRKQAAHVRLAAGWLRVILRRQLVRLRARRAELARVLAIHAQRQQIAWLPGRRYVLRRTARVNELVTRAARKSAVTSVTQHRLHQLFCSSNKQQSEQSKTLPNRSMQPVQHHAQFVGPLDALLHSSTRMKDTLAQLHLTLTNRDEQPATRTHTCVRLRTRQLVMSSR